MAAHLYWRLFITATGSGSYCAICELGMFDAAGNSLCTGGIPTASSDGFGYPSPQAFDGNFNQGGNFWHSNNSTPSVGNPDWLRYQFVSPVDVACIKITPRDDGGGTLYLPKNFKVQYSDNGTSWTDAVSYSTTSWLNGTGTRVFPVITPQTGYYTALRIDVKSTVQGSVSAADIEFRDVLGGSDLSSQLTLSSRAQSVFGAPTYSADKAFDTDNATFWSSAFVLSWIENHLNRAIKVAQIAWKSRPDSGDQSPTSFDLLGSNDGGFTWTLIQSFTSPATWTAGEQRVFDLVIAAVTKVAMII